MDVLPLPRFAERNPLSLQRRSRAQGKAKRFVPERQTFAGLPNVRPHGLHNRYWIALAQTHDMLG
jgi:hypothetical protein